MLDYDVNKMYEWPLPARAFILVFVFSLVVYLGYFFDLSSYNYQIRNSIEQESDLKQQLMLLINKQATMKNEIIQLPKLKNTLALWQQKIISKTGLPGLLDQILKYGEDNQIKIKTLDPGNEVKDGMYYKNSVKIDMTGTYDEIANYISQIANMPEMIIIDKYTLSKEIVDLSANSKPLNSDDILSADLTIDIYRK
jgi:type IV pilus assembly protein PilO